MGVDAAYEIIPGLAVKAKYLDEEDKINDSSRMLASAGIARNYENHYQRRDFAGDI